MDCTGSHSTWGSIVSAMAVIGHTRRLSSRAGATPSNGASATPSRSSRPDAAVPKPSSITGLPLSSMRATNRNCPPANRAGGMIAC